MFNYAQAQTIGPIFILSENCNQIAICNINEKYYIRSHIILIILEINATGSNDLLHIQTFKTHKMLFQKLYIRIDLIKRDYS